MSDSIEKQNGSATTDAVSNANFDPSSQAFVVGVLYESDEWSDYKLSMEIERQWKAQFESASGLYSAVSVDVRMINMECMDSVDEALVCDILMSRVFASALNRGHRHSLANMDELIERLSANEASARNGVSGRIEASARYESLQPLLLNCARAHRFEIDKRSSTKALGEAGLCVPQIFAWGQPDEIDVAAIEYPCVIKPNCSGRTVDTAITQNASEAEEFLAIAPQRVFLAQEYIEPEYGFITRVEIIKGKVALVVKRSVAKNGLSAYRFGSKYTIYENVPNGVIADSEKAAEILGFTFGSFDVIETCCGNFFIDANSVSNVSEDCTEMFGIDLMREYAHVLVELAKGLQMARA